MAYTPELSIKYSSTLRRFAWAMDLPMTTTINAILETAVERCDKAFICEKCRDRTKCDDCLFRKEEKP